MHTDLRRAGHFLLGRDYTGWPWTNRPDDPDTEGHGTHVTGIIAAEWRNPALYRGINPRSQVYVCKTAVGTTFDTYAFYRACVEITKAAIAGPWDHFVVNYSAGGLPGPRFPRPGSLPWLPGISFGSFLRLVAAWVVGMGGGLLCAAVGNFDPADTDLSLGPGDTGRVLEPASFSSHLNWVLGVGAVNSDRSLWQYSRKGRGVTVVAPGGRQTVGPPLLIESTWPDDTWCAKSGTSEATAYVTGLASLMWSQHPAWPNHKVRKRIERTAVRPPAATLKAYGHGVIDAYDAVR